MKDLLEYKLVSLTFGLLNGCDMTFAGYLMPTVINEAISNSFWMYLNFDNLWSSRVLIHHDKCNLNITTNKII